MSKLVLSLLVLTLLRGEAQADESRLLAPFLDEQTTAVLRLELGKLNLSALVEEIGGIRKEASAALVKQIQGLVKEGVDTVYVVVSLADTPDQYPFVVVPIRHKAKEREIIEKLGAFHKLDSNLGVLRLGDSLVVGSRAVRTRLKALKPTPRPDLLKGLAEEKGEARLVMVPTTDATRILEEVLPKLPREAGGGSIRPLSRGWLWLCVALDTSPKMVGRLTLQTRDAETAQELDKLLGQLLNLLASDEVVKEFVPSIPRLAGLWKPRRENARLTLSMDARTLREVVSSHLAPRPASKK